MELGELAFLNPAPIKRHVRTRCGDCQTRGWCAGCQTHKPFEAFGSGRLSGHYCLECRRIQHQKHPPRRVALPCGRCGGPKPAGRGRKYCEKCIPERIAERAKRMQGYRRAYHQRRRTADPEYIKQRNAKIPLSRKRTYYRRHMLAREYGLTLERFEEMLDQQNGACAICRGRFGDDRQPHVDHDHSSGEVRGLLCTNCNKALGLFGDNPESAARAAAYLERHAQLKLVV